VEEFNVIVGYAIQVLNQPSVRAATTLISILIALISFSVSIWAARKTSVVMTSHFSSQRSEQARFIEMQWKAIDENVLANPESARLMAEMFGLDGEAEARREAFHLMYLNTLSMAFVGWKHEAIDQDVYDGHMRYFFSHYKGSTDYVLHLVKLANYPSGFLSECERYLALARTAPLNSSKTASPQPETDAPAEGQFPSPAGQSA